MLFFLQAVEQESPIWIDSRNAHVSINQLAQLCWSLLSDSYHSTLCLTTDPVHVATAVIYLAMAILRVIIPRDYGVPWWALFWPEATPEQLEAISGRILAIYERRRVATNDTVLRDPSTTPPFGDRPEPTVRS